MKRSGQEPANMELVWVGISLTGATQAWLKMVKQIAEPTPSGTLSRGHLYLKLQAITLTIPRWRPSGSSAPLLDMLRGIGRLTERREGEPVKQGTREPGNQGTTTTETNWNLVLRKPLYTSHDNS